MTQWEAPPEEQTTTPPPSSEAITTPVTRTVVDESENFFSAFLSPGDIQAVTKTQVVSVPPSKSPRRPQEGKKNKETSVQKEVETQKSTSADRDEERQTVAENFKHGSSLVTPHADPITLEPVSPPASSPPSELSSNLDSKTGTVITDVGSTDSVDSKSAQSQTPSMQTAEQDATESVESPAATSEPKSSTPSDPSPSPSPKEVLLENKDSKVEDRQSDTPSPPVSAFSSGTSTTSDIEVLDHESVLSESSASSRQETGEGKAGLHLMQGSFQLLTASTCGDFPRLEDYAKLTESCGSSSDAFERIDSFSVQSLDSRSVSEVNSDDEIPGSRTLASVTAGPASLTESSAVCEKPKDGVVERVGEEEEETFTETMREHSLDEMEESGRSATPVNSEQPEELMEQEQESEANVTLPDPASITEEQLVPPITEEMKSFSTVQILELQKVSVESMNLKCFIHIIHICMCVACTTLECKMEGNSFARLSCHILPCCQEQPFIAFFLNCHVMEDHFLKSWPIDGHSVWLCISICPVSPVMLKLNEEGCFRMVFT